MKVDPVKDAARPTGTHEVPGKADRRGAGDATSGQEEIVGGRNPTQRKIDEEKQHSGKPNEKPVVPG